MKSHPVEHGARGRGLIVTAGRILVIVLVALVALHVWDVLTPGFRRSRGPAGWTVFRSSSDAWTVQVPNSWHAQEVSFGHRGHPYGQQVRTLVVSNIDRRFEQRDVGSNGSSPYVDARWLPSTAVVTQIGFIYGGGFSCQASFDTARPLSLANAQRSTIRSGRNGTPQIELSMGFTAHGSPFSISAWIGSRATKADLGRLERIVASISWDHALPTDSGSRNTC